jgi:hypothetical protein
LVLPELKARYHTLLNFIQPERLDGKSIQPMDNLHINFFRELELPGKNTSFKYIILFSLLS